MKDFDLKLSGFMWEMCFLFLFLLRGVWKPLNHHQQTQNCDCSGSQIPHLLPSRNDFSIFKRTSHTFSAYLSKHTHLGAVSVSVCCQLSPRRTSVRPTGCHTRIWNVPRLLAWVIILRIFQGHISARKPYVRGHRGAL